MRREQLWRAFYRQWPPRHHTEQSGYTVLLPIPGDLPVFLKMALAVCEFQNLNHCQKIVVIPDQRHADFEQAFEAAQQTWTGPPLVLANLHPVAGQIAKQLNQGGTNHWLQILQGIKHTETRYALLHDADLFITDPHFFEQHYRFGHQQNLAVVGVHPAWDTWLATHGYEHVIATWEMLFDVNWARSFPAWTHKGQHRRLLGQNRFFDTFFWAQCHTPGHKIALNPVNAGFVHFNYVISNYRKFQRSFQRQRKPFEDTRFCLLLVRLLIDIFDPEGQKTYAIPEFSQFVRGLSHLNGPIMYSTPQTAEQYPIFRSKLSQLLDSPYIHPTSARALNKRLSPFDNHFKSTSPVTPLPTIETRG